MQTDASSPRGLVLDGVAFSYDTQRHPLFCDFSIKFNAGTVTSILGRSGCGKSTLLNIIAGTLTPSGGVVKFHTGSGGGRGHPIVGMVFQAATLVPWRSISENVSLGLELVSGGGPALYRGEARTALEKFGLGDYANAHPHAISGGMQQRVSILRAVLPRPEILLLDEPFSSQDSLMRRTLQQDLSSYVNRSDCVVLLVTHDLEDALRFSDRVVLVGGSPLRILDDFDIAGDRERRISEGFGSVSGLSNYYERVWKVWSP